MRTTLTAQFDRPDLVPHAARCLRQAGFSEHDMTLHTAGDGAAAARTVRPGGPVRRLFGRVREVFAHTPRARPPDGANSLTLTVDDEVSDVQRAWVLLFEEGACAVDSAHPDRPAPAPASRAAGVPELFRAQGPLSMQYSRQNEPSLFAGQALQEALPHLARYRPEEPAGTAPEPELGTVDWLDLPVVRRSCEEHATELGPEIEYRRHWRSRYPDVPFAEVEAAYEFGAEMSCGERYQGHSWEQAEPCLRDDWETSAKRDIDWDWVLPAVRFGWELFREVER